jgi:hypothetical protein
MVQQIKADKDYTLVTQIMQIADIFVKVRERELLPQNLSATSAAILFWWTLMGKDVTPARFPACLLREPHTFSVILMRWKNRGDQTNKNMESKNLIRFTLTQRERTP